MEAMDEEYSGSIVAKERRELEKYFAQPSVESLPKDAAQRFFTYRALDIAFWMNGADRYQTFGDSKTESKNRVTKEYPVGFVSLMT